HAGRRLSRRGDRAPGGDLPVGARRDPQPEQRGHAAALAREGGAGAGAVPGVRAAGGQRVVPDLGGRRVARGDRRRLSAPARGAAAASAAAVLSRNAAVTIGLAIVVRVGVFAFAENKHGDAPMRALIAERMVIDPASAAVPRTYCQFGPLHTTLMRPFIALDRE